MSKQVERPADCDSTWEQCVEFGCPCLEAVMVGVIAAWAALMRWAGAIQ